METLEKLITLPVALAVGSALGFVINHLISLYSSKKEREHKRLELLISFLQSELIRLDERLDRIINSSLPTVGIAFERENFQCKNQNEHELCNDSIISFSIKQNICELNNLELLCDTYDVTGKIKTNIEKIREDLELQSNEKSSAKLLSDCVTTLMDIQLQFRLLIHVLSEKLLNS